MGSPEQTFSSTVQCALNWSLKMEIGHKFIGCKISSIVFISEQGNTHFLSKKCVKPPSLYQKSTWISISSNLRSLTLESLVLTLKQLFFCCLRRVRSIWPSTYWRQKYWQGRGIDTTTSTSRSKGVSTSKGMWVCVAYLVLSILHLKALLQLLTWTCWSIP